MRLRYVPELFRHLKVAIDRDRHTMGRFILTGSQKFSLMQHVADSLAGRCAIVELETLYIERDVRQLLNVGSLWDFERFLRA